MSANVQRSTFVTVLAWIFIALSAFATLSSILQNIVAQTLFRGPEFSQLLQSTPSGAPPIAAFVFGHFQLIFVTALVVSVAMLVSSIGLLRRWNWARLVFVALMVLAIAWQLGGLALQFFMFSSMHAQFADAAAHGGPDFETFFIVVGVASVLFALGFSVLFGWIASRLLSAPIAAEFHR